VPIGVAGELYIGGDGVARGFINRPALTAQRFPRDPFSSEPGARMYKTGDQGRFHPDGMIELLGRVDNQVKIRGYRIELGEIEAVLQEHESVRQGVVMAREDVPGNKYLVAYVVPHENASPPVSEWREFLKGRLPEYMVPVAFMTLNELPLTSNGKVNRRAFPVPERVGSENSYVAPRNELEQTIANIWQTLLALERVGIHENFFEVGGHSLLAFHLVLKLTDTLKIEFPLRSLFEYPTIAELAEVIEEIRGSEEADSKDQETA
jgi:acyl carrier protein